MPVKNPMIIALIFLVTLIGMTLQAEPILIDPPSGARVRLRIDPQAPRDRLVLEHALVTHAVTLVRCLLASDRSTGGLPSRLTLLLQLRVRRALSVPPHGSRAVLVCFTAWLGTHLPSGLQSRSAVVQVEFLSGFRHRAPTRYAPPVITGPAPPNPNPVPPNTGPMPPNTGPVPPNTGPMPPNTGPVPPNTGPVPPNNDPVQTHPTSPLPPERYRPRPYPDRTPRRLPPPTPDEIATIALVVRGTRGPKAERKQIKSIATQHDTRLRGCAARYLKRLKGRIVFEVEPLPKRGFEINTRHNSTNDRLSVCLKRMLILPLRRIVLTAAVTFEMDIKRIARTKGKVR
ncbi:MAG: hypothetical protein KC609_04160 [Myxococcales bacterium]|nr:hypothetical protein [Myxococcales bacterium]